ncbi:MAG: hypothetical protein FWG34_08940 [Oscillospiraceae bacterium]|nr:hypothetical protein [Oscillospiraceae bacterium]
MGSLSETASGYAKKNPVRFHMPGHKGRPKNGLNYSLDLTELFFTDSLYEPDKKTNLVYALEKRLSECYFGGADIYSLISCAGATLCVQASVHALKKSKKNANPCIICDRASHVSFANAVTLLEIAPLWVYPGEDFPEKIAEYAKRQNFGDILGVYVTSPDYYGAMKDIGKISRECKKHSLDLIVDNSHGSHLAFHKNGAMHPMNLGADVSIDSIHKTLPVLTGAALLFAGSKFDKEKTMRPSMKMFASTSPSYLILQSVEQMADLLEQKGDFMHGRLLEEIESFEKKAGNLGFAFESGELRDPYRIILNCAGSGEKLYYFLASQNIFCEFYDYDSVVAMTSISNEAGDFQKLFLALEKFSRDNEIVCPKQKKAAYPPGVPGTVPGEENHKKGGFCNETHTCDSP